MNPPDWETVVRSLQSCGGVGTGQMDALYKCPAYTDEVPHSSLDVGQQGLSPPAHSLQKQQLSHVEGQDGEPLEVGSEDPELARKRKELRQIEEQIVQKKVALALKRVEPFLKKTMPGASCDTEAATCIGDTLRNRVNVILQQRQSLAFLKKVQSPRETITLSSLRKDSLLQDHPLKRRVKALMKQRSTNPSLLPTTIERENSANQGFQRFLSILNKGVDMDFLSRIVNDDSEDIPLGEELLNIQAPTVGNKPSHHFRSESQQSNSGSPLPGCSHTSSGEGTTEPTSQEGVHHEELSLPNDEEKKNDGGDRCFGSSSRSKSPTTVKKKKKKEVEKPKLDEQREQLQNIIKTLGLDLEVEEMSKLADRTQERLYGKKHEGRVEQESPQQSASHRHRNSSSSSCSSSFSCCSSSSSRSTSRSFSPSPSGSHGRDSNPRLQCERGCSRDRGRGALKNQDCNRGRKEAHKLSERGEKNAQSISSQQHPSDEDFTLFPHDTWSQYSATFHGGKFGTNTNPFWTYTQAAAPAPLYSGGFHHQQNTYHQFRGPDAGYSNHAFEDINLLVNPDLSRSEGQSGSTSGSRCLQVINTRSAPNGGPQRISVLKPLTRGRKRKNRGAYQLRCPLMKESKKKKKKKKKKKQQKMTEKQSQHPVQTLQVSQDNEAKQSEEVKEEPTEEEIKANLRKKLKAFNQRVKQNLHQPAALQEFKSVESQDCV